MNAEALLKHYDRIADAPDAVGGLRQFVLKLAVRGKLLPQDPTDESAAVLLNKIAAEKSRLITTGELRKPRDLDVGEDVDTPFPIPASWIWTRLDSIGAIVGGGTPSASDADNFAEPGAGTPWLTPADLGGYNSLHISRGARDLTQKGLLSSSATVMPPGSVLFTSRAPIGYVAIAANPISTNQGFKSIVPYIAGCSHFIAIALKAFASDIDAKASGTTFKEVSGKIVSAIAFPLPPLAEQHRIVAKVDQLMALCDRLEAARAEREATRDRLAAASLARLNTPDPDPETFKSHASFAISTALPALTTRADQIKQLRQTILNLAVRGKLVAQDSSDAPASQFLSELAETISTYCTVNRVRRTIPPAISEVPFVLPSGWQWTRLSELFLVITDGDHQPPPKSGEGVAFLTIGNVTSGRLDFSDCRLVQEEYFNAIPKYRVPELGDILYTVVGATFGRPCPVDTNRPFCVQRHIAILKPAAGTDQQFLVRLLSSPLIYSQAASGTTGTAQPTIALAQLRSFLAPVPPIEEQHRIVEKVNELMQLCDQLEASLHSGADTRRRLLDALLHEALASSNRIEEAA